MKNRSVFLAFLLLSVILTSCDTSAPVYYKIAGFTQGTTYHMTVELKIKDTVGFKNEIDNLLHEFDMSLSTYIPESNISRVNSNETSEVDNQVLEVISEARRINELSNGAFDLTVKPLIDAWGFGAGRKITMSQHVIDSLLQFVGMDKILIEGNTLVKKDERVKLDVNAIAQGYAVDVVCEYLEDKGVLNYMVEIGGEMRCLGVSPRAVDWRVGVDKPFFGNKIPGENLQQILTLSGKSLASSGNYRKYYETEDGQKIVHTIDPVTGYTRMSELLSVTIVCDECITADALATTCMVLGLEKAKDFILEQEGVEAYFVFSDEDGLYLEWSTEGMKKLLQM